MRLITPAELRFSPMHTTRLQRRHFMPLTSERGPIISSHYRIEAFDTDVSLHTERYAWALFLYFYHAARIYTIYITLFICPISLRHSRALYTHSGAGRVEMRFMFLLKSI